MKTKPILATLLISLALTVSASADIPRVMNFQGKATDKQGAPLNGPCKLTVRIYDAETSASALWTEVHDNVAVANGIFQVLLGSKTPLDLPFDKNYWVSAEIGTDGEMTPRTRLASVGYAYTAKSLTEAPVIPFYKKGFEIEYVDFNSVRVAPGVIDIAGAMFTTTYYSPTLQLESLGGTLWLHGSKTNNSLAHVYAYNNNGKIGFGFSDERPDLSDHLGNTEKKPLLYQRYPDTEDGIYYRYIGSVKINSNGTVSAIKNDNENEPASIFYTFGSDGRDGNIIISKDTGDKKFSDLTNNISNYYLQTNNFTIDKEAKLTVDTGWAYIGVKGTCVIHGIIDADGGGWKGGGGSQSIYLHGQKADGSIMQNNSEISGGVNAAPIAFCVAGAGGGSNTQSQSQGGGWGGGAGGSGGVGAKYTGTSGGNAMPTPAEKVAEVKSLLHNSSGSALSFFIANIAKVLSFRGAGGGGMNASYAGGNGGGTIYVECDTLIFDGVLTADGIAGPQGCGGGGIILVRAKNIVANNGTISVDGGRGIGGVGDGADGFAEIILLQ